MKAIILIDVMLILCFPIYAQQSKSEPGEYDCIATGQPDGSIDLRCEKRDEKDTSSTQNTKSSSGVGDFPATEHGSGKDATGNQKTSGNPQNSKEAIPSNQQSGKPEEQICLSAEDLQRLCEEGDLCGEDSLDTQAAPLPSSKALGFSAKILGLAPSGQAALNTQELLSKWYGHTLQSQSNTNSQTVGFASKMLGAGSLSKDMCLNAKRFRSAYQKHFGSAVILNLKPLAFFKTKMLVTQHPDLIYVTCVFRPKDHEKERAKKARNPHYIPGSGPHPQRIGVDVLPGGKIFGQNADWRKVRPTHKNYDPKKTQEIVDAIKRIDPDAIIFFNDPQIIGVKFSKDHHDHIHITWSGKSICLIPQASSNK